MGGGEAASAVGATWRGGHRVAGRYLIETMLGRGGVATVYVAFDEHTEQRVALKCLLRASEPNDTRMVALFQREYHTLGQITHPGIVRVFEYGISEAGPFYSMELLDGRDSSEVAPLPYRDACRVLREVASALAMLHSRRLIHRDLSHRNVRLTSDGRAKLFDFGAMTPMGFVPDVIGTPPFIAPEATNGEPLDQRTDLYALGALAYWLLCGRHAYPAKSVRELRELWARGDAQPPPLARPDVPRGLAQLVLSLLQRDPMARPSSAAEVIDRLRVQGELAPSQELGVARSYLANPKLIGRKQDLKRSSELLERGLLGEGAVLMIEGSSGTGKTRLLQEVVIQAKLAGATVLQVAAQAIEHAAHSVARALVEQLLEKQPDAASGASAECSEALAALIPAFAARAPDEVARLRPRNVKEQRARVHAELCAFLLAQSARVPLVLAIDDLHACDESSLALLAALGAEGAAHRLVIVGTLLVPGTDGSAFAVLRSRATQVIELRPFSAVETESLVESLFGNPPSSQRLAGWMHEHAHGNPLECLELARHLVDRRAAYYADGAWTLPDELPAGLPTQLSESFTARVAALEPEARALAEGLALYGKPASLSLCMELCRPLGEAAVFLALNRLVSAEIVAGRGDEHWLSREGIRDSLLAELSEGRRAQLHQRIGDVLAARGLPDAAAKLEAGHHWMRGHAELRGVELIEQGLTDGEALAELGASAVPALERALRICAATSQSRARCTRLQAWLVRCAFLYDRRLLAHADVLIERLREDSGLASIEDAQAVGPAGVAPVWRALGRARARYDAASETARGLHPIEALTMLAHVVGSTLAGAIFAYDRARVEWLAEVVAPFATLEKQHSLALIYDLVSAVVQALRGCTRRALELRQAMLARLYDPSMYRGLQDDDRKNALATQLHALGMFEAGLDSQRPLAIADQIDALGLEMYAGAAVQIRLLSELYRGDMQAAKASQVRMESLSLQNGAGRQTEIWILGYLIGPHALLGDIIGLKRIAERLALMVADNPGYRVLLLLALGAYRRARGQIAEARTALERALQLAPRGQHAFWAVAICHYIEVLVASGDYQRALELAQASFETGSDELGEPDFMRIVLPSVALAHAQLGRCADAASLLETAIACANNVHLPVVRICALHEARARVAILSGDRAAFERHASEASARYRALNNSMLMARHLLLLDEAVQRGLVPRHEGARPEQAGITSMPTVDLASDGTEITLPLEALLDL